MNTKPLTDEIGEVRELTADDFSQAKLASEVPELQGMIKAMGRPKSKVTKVSTTMRFDQETLDYFKSTGKGWQTRMSNVLTEYAKAHS